MAYLVSQLRKENNQTGTYMENVSVSSSTITSPNTFGGSQTFTDFALEGSFIPGQVYYLRFKIHKIPHYFYSGSRTEPELAMYQNAEELQLQILLKNNQENDEEKSPPEIVGTCSVPKSLYNQSEEYSSYSFVFSPSKTFNRLGFRINRGSYDVIVGPRNWLIDQTVNQTVPVYGPKAGEQTNVSTVGPRIKWTGEDGDVCTLVNLVETTPARTSGFLKFGYQCRPGSLIVVNGEPIRLGRSGIYQLNNGTTIKKFMIASPGGSTDSKIDAFLLDYAYKT